MMKFFELICLVNAIINYSKDIHYNVTGGTMYGNHLFADKTANADNAYDYIDLIKEVCFLGRGEPTPESRVIESRVAEITPNITDDETANWQQLKRLIMLALVEIESLDKLTKGEENLIGALAQDLQQTNGLLGLRVDDLPIEEQMVDNVDFNAGLSQTAENGSHYDPNQPRAKDGKWTSGGGNVIEIDPNHLGSKSMSADELRKKAIEYYKDNLAGTSVEHPELGNVLFSNAGYKKPVSFSADIRKLRLFPYLPEMIQKGDVLKDEEDKRSRSNVTAFYTIRSHINIDGEKQVVRVSIRKDNMGKLYYDHVIAKKLPEKHQPETNHGGSGSDKADNSTLVNNSIADNEYVVNIFFEGEYFYEVDNENPYHDELGKFTSESNAKFSQVNIDFEKDNILPGLIKKDLSDLGIDDKPVLLKKNVIDRNLRKHPEVKKEDYERIIATALYKHDSLKKGNADKPYYNFMARVGENKSSVVLLDVEEKKDHLEIVHLHWVYNKQRNALERKGDEIEKDAS